MNDTVTASPGPFSRAGTGIAGQSYDDFVVRAAQDPVGNQVKLADLMENGDLSTMAEPSQKDLQRVEKYRRAIIYLNAN